LAFITVAVMLSTYSLALGAVPSIESRPDPPRIAVEDRSPDGRVNLSREIA
jgi:hypothetical protein